MLYCSTRDAAYPIMLCKECGPTKSSPTIMQWCLRVCCVHIYISSGFCVWLMQINDYYGASEKTQRIDNFTSCRSVYVIVCLCKRINIRKLLRRQPNEVICYFTPNNRYTTVSCTKGKLNNTLDCNEGLDIRLILWRKGARAQAGT